MACRPSLLLTSAPNCDDAKWLTDSGQAALRRIEEAEPGPDGPQAQWPSGHSVVVRLSRMHAEGSHRFAHLEGSWGRLGLMLEGRIIATSAGWVTSVNHAGAEGCVP
jgi:hypothetical protein